MDWWAQAAKDTGIKHPCCIPRVRSLKTPWTHTVDLQTKELHQKLDPETGGMEFVQVYPEGDTRQIYSKPMKNGVGPDRITAKDEETGEWRGGGG